MEIKSSKTLWYWNINTHLEYLYIFTLFDLDDFSQESFLNKIDSWEKSWENWFWLLKIRKEGEKVYFEKHWENYYIYNKKIFNIKNNSEINWNDYLYRNWLFWDLFKMHSFISLWIVEFYKNNWNEYFNITNKWIKFINELKLVLWNNFSKYNKDYIKNNEQKLYNIFKDFFINSFIYKRITEFSSLKIDDIINDLSSVNDENYKITFNEINELKRVWNINLVSLETFFILFWKYHWANGKNANNRIAYIKAYLEYFDFIKKWKLILETKKSKIQELSIEYNSDNLLKNLKEYIKQDKFFNDIKIWNVNSNKYFQLWLKWNNRISNNWIHFEVIKRKNQLFLEIHFENKENNDFINRINIDENKYEWFDWFESKSIRNKKIFELNENNFEEIKNSLIEMYKDFNNKLNPLTSKSDKMIENLTSQESLLLLSLLTKPFSILYWVSWTWKSRVVKELWKKMYWEDYKNYFHKEAVPPNWFDETEVLGRYNEIEKYKEGSFIKHLEKAIKDKDHNYVYLLDEMNLSHIEQYFAQYLSAIEELNSDNAWIHVGEKTNNIKKIDKIVNKELIININNPQNVVKKYAFSKWEFSINWFEIKSESDFADFHKKIFKYIVNNYKEDFSEEILEKTEITTIDKLLEEGYKIVWEIDYNKEWWTNFYMKKEWWSSTNNYFYYKWYVIATWFNYNNRIKKIIKLVEFIWKEHLDNLKLVFIPYDKENQEKNVENKNIIEYYNDNDELVWKSLKIPKNLFVVGTINLDETTKSISPKVVDRANLIEFNDIWDFLGIEEENNRYKLDFLENVKIEENFDKYFEIRKEILDKVNWDNIDNIEENTIKVIWKLYNFLKQFKLHFSYRTIKEILIFVLIWKEVLGKDKEKLLLDLAILQKVLPKLNWVIDYNLKLYSEEENKEIPYLWYDSENNNKIKKWFYNNKEDFTNSAIKLERMQQFFDIYQNINYFLS